MKIFLFLSFLSFIISTETETILKIDENIQKIDDTPPSSTTSSSSSSSSSVDSNDWSHIHFPNFWHPSDWLIKPFDHHFSHFPSHFHSHFPLHHFNFPSIHSPSDLYSSFLSAYPQHKSSSSSSSLSSTNSNSHEISLNAPMDIKENEKGYEVSIELPGVKKEEISITVKGNVMTIKGERKFEEKKDNEKYHRVERYFGSSSRSFTLPPHVNKDDVKASYIDGVLHLTIPKKDGICKDEIKVEIM